MEPRALRHSHRGAITAAAGVIAVGLCGLAGWIFDHEGLKAVYPGGAAIKANTSIGLILAGAALAGVATGASASRFVRTCALVVGLLGILTLTEHLSGWDLGVDQLLFQEAPGAFATTSPGRMGPPAAFSFILAAIAMLLAPSRSRTGQVAYQVLAGLLCVVALIPLIGYAYGVDALYGIARYTGIAIHTATAFFLLGFGLLLARPTLGVMAMICARDAGGTMARRLIIPALLLPFLVGWLRWLGDTTGILNPLVSRPLSVLVLTVGAVLLILLNVRPLSRVDRQRSQGERRLRTVTENAPVLLANVDRQHRYVFVNGNYARQFGRTPEEVVGDRVPNVVGAGLYAKIKPRLDSALAGQRVEFELELPGATPKWLHVICAPEEDSNGETCGVIAVIQDMTERKQAALELQWAHDRALEASRAKDEFIAMLSHELRTPLSPVLLAASDGAENPQWPAEVRETFARIRQLVEQEARLIDDLLDLSRIVRRQMPLNFTLLDGATALREAVATLEPEAAAKRQKLSLLLEPTPVRIRADQIRLQQIFWNVLKNAVKFTPTGGSIQVTGQVVDQANFVVCVTDTGIGMTDGELARAFEPFAQGDHAAQAHQHGFGGLGVGLAIARLLAIQHGGTISAQSAGRDCGTTLRIILPLHHAEDARLTANPSLPAILRAPPGSHVLVVEDHDATRDTLVGILRRRGYNISAASSMTAALEAARQQPVDLLISDLGLPDGDGCSLLRQLRQTQTVPGIALTGYGMDEDITRTREAGFVCHLTKPVNLQALDEAIARALPPPVVQ
jgi:PAS domain S-box-containing protein